MKRSHTHILIPLLLLITAGLFSCKRFDEPTLNLDLDGQSTMSLAELNNMVIDESITVTQPILVEGYVVSNDAASNYHKTFIINDASSGVEIMAGLYDLNIYYPEGQKVYISLEGCTLARSYGVLQIGLKAEQHSGFDIDYFGSRVLLDKHITRSAENKKIEPPTLAIPDLQPTDCGRLIRINALRLCSADYAEEWNINTEGRWQGYNIFIDSDGGKIAVYTSDYATYRDAYIPHEEVDIVGVLQRGTVAGEEMYMLKMNAEDDCQNI